MKGSLHILFFPYKSKVNSKGTCPLFCRITVNGVRAQFSTGISIKEVYWNSKAQRIRGTSVDVIQLNNNLSHIHRKLYSAYLEVQANMEGFSVRDILQFYNGDDKVKKTLLQTFEFHNCRMKELIGKEYVQATYDKFVVIQRHIQSFIKQTYGKEDYPLNALPLTFIEDLDFHLKTRCNLNQNTINKIIERLQKVIKIAIGKRWLDHNPFLLYKKTTYTKVVVFLSKEELIKLESYHFSQLRLSTVRDSFVLSCYTGLAYNEAARLTNEHVVDHHGLKWIRMTRQKTGRPLSIPLLPKAISLLSKMGYPYKSGPILPVISNQKMNSYLKEIGEVIGIDKILTHHVARKTFASTVLMANDVPIEIISSLLGHSKTSTTETHYAKVVEDNVVKHINLLLSKL